MKSTVLLLLISTSLLFMNCTRDTDEYQVVFGKVWRIGSPIKLSFLTNNF